MKIEEITQTELANEVFEIIYYDLDDELELATNKLQNQLGRHDEKEYHDHENTKNLLVSAIYDRLSRAKLNTLQRYSNNIELMKRLISQTAKGVKDSETNDTKIYTVDRELVVDDEGNQGIKQVRKYATQVSFDYTANEETFKLSDVISVDDVRVPEMREFNKGLAIQVLKNVDMFSKPMRGFVAMLFTEGSEKTQELLEMSVSRFNQTIARLENWIEKHRDSFDSILTYDEQMKLDSLTDMAHFNNLLSVAESETVQRWIASNTDKEWVKLILDDYVDNADEVIINWDKSGHRKNSYMFVNAIADLENEYSKVLK